MAALDDIRLDVRAHDLGTNEAVADHRHMIQEAALALPLLVFASAVQLVLGDQDEGDEEPSHQENLNPKRYLILNRSTLYLETQVDH